MITINTPEAMRAWARCQKEQRQRIALVPTMGYLHEGHLSLVAAAKQHADSVIVSIFVNPLQFGPSEDLDRYPRDLQGDLDKLARAGADVVFTPASHAIYNDQFDTHIVPNQLAQTLCGASRPIHFRGVCTVVELLFRITLCDVAVFGEKDYQQLQIIRRMVTDLWLDVDIIGMPIVREADGLAMSSRNAYLVGEQRQHALVLQRAMHTMQRAVDSGDPQWRSTQKLCDRARAIISDVPSAHIDYVEIVHPDTLQPLEQITPNQPGRAVLAVWIGKTRLIDNCELSVL